MQQWRDGDRKSHLKKIEFLIKFLEKEYQKILTKEKHVEIRKSAADLMHHDLCDDDVRYESSELKEFLAAKEDQPRIRDADFYDRNF